ncbi:Bactericidal permeability-increasing protein [Geodia barretti]|uniref:Bactericidal permeability-increasing protein n=1 Tax=Geodia barretti TaxID=519541 RepID=A0AA35WY42_GEOBA|nr:Bactericidal permeability-increasing protein [Geodia barretti]
MRPPPALWLCVVTVGVQVLLLPSGTVAFTSAVNPGFRTILTQKGLNYANGVAFPLLKERISNFSIQNFTKSFKVPIIGMITFTLTNAKILSLNFGDSSMTLAKNGLTLVDNGISLALSADWSYDTVYGAPMNTSASGPNVKGHGTVDVSGRGISLKMTVDMTMNKSSGGIHLNCSYCSVVTYTWNGVEIDYTLVADPDFTHSGVVIFDNKGEFRLGKDPQDPPFPPPPFPDPSLRNFSKMIYLQGSTYVAESASWAFWKAGLLSYNVSNEQIPTGFKTTGFYCAIVSPELCKKYPNKKVMFGVVASDYPRLNITPEYAVVMGKALASMYVKNNGREEIAFTLNLCSTLKNILTTLAPSLGLAYINSILGAGVPIPVIDGVTFINPSLTFGKASLDRRSYMYNLFGPALNGFLKRELNKKACNELIKWFNETTKKYINPLPTTINVADGIEIDYGLVSDADFSRKGRVVTNHKGEFLLLPNATDPPFQPPPLPDPSEEDFPNTKMVHVVVSNYVAETAAYAFKEAGQLAYNITSDKTLCDKFPKMNVMLGVAVSGIPTLNITTNHTAMEAEVEVTMFVANGNGREDVAFVLDFVSMDLPTKIVDITLKNSTIGQFDITKLKDVITYALLPLGVSYVNNKYTRPGFPIPAKGGVTFANTTITEREACQQLTNWTNEYTNMYLGPLPTTIVFSGIEIDYGLVSDADFSRKGRVVTNHKGEILIQSDPTNPPFTPPPLPDPSEEKFPGSKMIYLVISKYVAESASYAFWKAGRMTYNLSTTDLPPFLRKTSFGVTCCVLKCSGGDEMAFVLQFVSRNLILMSNDTGWCACMSDFKDAEDYTQPGVPIPTNNGIVFTNTTLKLGEGYVVIGSDVLYTPEFLPSNMTCIYH